MFDDLDDDDQENESAYEIVEPGISQSDSDANSNVIEPEKRFISLPSRWLIKDHRYRQVELQLRVKQAAASLSALRDLIAEKSFQYSHVIRVAPRKGVKTRARSSIAQLNYQIGYQCRVYNRCRAAMEILEADANILRTYQILHRQDIRCSTALLNPNEPGSTRHQLSWIWQSGKQSLATESDGLRECKSL